MRLPATALPRRFLKPGEMMLCREPCQVTTVLGPCVAVTFFSARLKLAAICHAMLPSPRGGCTEPCFPEPQWKYVSIVLPELMHWFLPPGSGSDVEVKIFGGAHLLQARGASPSTTKASVGSANVALARELLAVAGFVLCASDTGGTIGRKVVFDTQSGAVHVKCLRKFLN